MLRLIFPLFRLTKVVASFKGNSLVLPKSLPSSPERTPSVSPRATDRCNEVTDPVRQVRFRFYELFSLLTIGSRFLQRDVYLLSISDLLILRILKEVDNDVQITCQWLASLLSWRKKLAITSIVRTDFSQDVLDRQILQFLHGKKRNMLVCDAVKLFQLSEEIGPLQTVRLIVYNFEKIWYGGATSNISLVVSFGYMDPQICSKIPNRHLLNEVVCGCGYFRYPSFCEKIVLVNWRSDKESDTVYNDFVSRDWPFEVKSRICFAKHHEVLKYVFDSVFLASRDKRTFQLTKLASVVVLLEWSSKTSAARHTKRLIYVFVSPNMDFLHMVKPLYSILTSQVDLI